MSLLYLLPMLLLYTYYPPGCFPMGKQRRRNAPTMAPSNICKRNSAVQCRNMAYWQHRNPVRPKRFCSKICYVGGRMISVILWCDRPRRSLDFDSLRGAPPYTAYATELPPQKFRGVVGEDIIFPVISPMGK